MSKHIARFHLHVLLLALMLFPHPSFARNEYEYTTLCNLYKMTNGSNWAWAQTSDVYSSNTAAWDCSDDSTSDPCIDNWQGVTCSNSTFGSEPTINSLSLIAMNISGPCPSFFNLSNLLSLDLSRNSISGSLPQVPNTELVRYNVRSNNFTGAISESFSKFKSLRSWQTSLNNLHGTIPNFFANFTKLQRFTIHSNKHTGTIPESFYEIQTLAYFRIFDNLFTGRLPNSLGSLTNMIFFEIHMNRFYGTIPPDAANMRKLRTFDIHENSFTGPLPDLSNCFELLDFYVHNNDLSGKLPNLGGLLNLTNIAVSANNFHGSLHDIFRVTLPKLQLAAFSDNAFTGQLPGNLFNSSVLYTFSASENCMYSEIPSNICLASNLKYLGISGLSVAPQCSWASQIHIKSVRGSLPPCIWSLPKLSVLDSSENGIKGTIPTISNYSKLEHVDISGNHFTSTIPRSLLTSSNLISLDLHNNKLTGTIPQVKIFAEKVILHTNRLSGFLSINIFPNAEIDVLKGGTFDCDSDFPEGDPAHLTYICGSRSLDSSLIVYWITFGVLGFYTIYSIIQKSPIFSLDSIVCHDISKEFEIVPNVKMLMISTFRTVKTTLILGIIIFIIQLIVFPSLKADIDFSTLSFQYSWEVSAGFMSGSGPLTVLTLIIIFANTFYFWKTRSNHENLVWTHVRSVGRSTSSSTYYGEHSSDLFEKFAKTTMVFAGFIIFVCWGIVVVLDAMYVILVDYCRNIYDLKALVFVYILVSVLLKEYFGSIVLYRLVGRLRNEQRIPKYWGTIYLRSILNLLCDIISPVIATLFSSASCFVSLFLPEDVNPEPYNLTLCSLRDETNPLVCIDEIVENQELLVQAPLIYNNLCRNDLLQRFIPAISFSMAFEAIFFIALYFYFVSQKSPITTVRHELLSLFGAVYWPSEQLERPFRFVYSPQHFLTRQNILVIILLTYGILSPVILVSVCINMAILYVVHRHMLLRYIKECKSETNIKALEQKCENSWLGTKTFATTTVVFSILFHGPFLMDMALDTYSFGQSVWILILFPVVLFLFLYFYSDQESDIKEKVVLDELVRRSSARQSGFEISLQHLSRPSLNSMTNEVTLAHTDHSNDMPSIVVSTTNQMHEEPKPTDINLQVVGVN